MKKLGVCMVAVLLCAVVLSFVACNGNTSTPVVSDYQEVTTTDISDKTTVTADDYTKVSGMEAASLAYSTLKNTPNVALNLMMQILFMLKEDTGKSVNLGLVLQIRNEVLSASEDHKKSGVVDYTNTASATIDHLDAEASVSMDSLMTLGKSIWFFIANSGSARSLSIPADVYAKLSGLVKINMVTGKNQTPKDLGAGAYLKLDVNDPISFSLDKNKKLTAASGSATIGLNFSYVSSATYDSSSNSIAVPIRISLNLKEFTITGAQIIEIYKLSQSTSKDDQANALIKLYAILGIAPETNVLTVSFKDSTGAWVDKGYKLMETVDLFILPFFV